MKIQIASQNQLLKCAYCGKRLSSVLALTVGFSPEGHRMLSEYAGKAIILETNSGNFPMIVSSMESEAKKNGYDGMFSLCSKECVTKLQGILARDVRPLFERNFILN